MQTRFQKSIQTQVPYAKEKKKKKKKKIPEIFWVKTL